MKKVFFIIWLLLIELNLTLYADNSAQNLTMTYEEVLKTAEKTVQKSIDEFGINDIRTAETYYNTGQIFYSIPDYKQALIYNQKALDIL